MVECIFISKANKQKKTQQILQSKLKLTRVKQGFNIDAVGLVQTWFLFKNLQEERTNKPDLSDADVHVTGRIQPTWAWKCIKDSAMSGWSRGPARSTKDQTRPQTSRWDSVHCYHLAEIQPAWQTSASPPDSGCWRCVAPPQQICEWSNQNRENEVSETFRPSPGGGGGGGRLPAVPGPELRPAERRCRCVRASRSAEPPWAQSRAGGFGGTFRTPCTSPGGKRGRGEEPAGKSFSQSRNISTRHPPAVPRPPPSHQAACWGVSGSRGTLAAAQQPPGKKKSITGIFHTASTEEPSWNHSCATHWVLCALGGGACLAGRSLKAVCLSADVQSGEEAGQHSQDVDDGLFVSGIRLSGTRWEWGAVYFSESSLVKQQVVQSQAVPAAFQLRLSPPNLFRGCWSLSWFTSSVARVSSCLMCGDIREWSLSRTSSSGRAERRKPRACISHMHWLLCAHTHTHTHTHKHDSWCISAPTSHRLICCLLTLWISFSSASCRGWWRSINPGCHVDG